MPDKQAVLVAVDGSNHSLRALAYAAKRARTHKDLQLYALNVQRALLTSLFVTRAMIQEHHRARSQAQLARAHKLLARQSIRTDPMVRIGDPASTIVNTARRAHCTEIVTGTRGLGRLKGLVLGSVTTKAIHPARIPVTVVP
jgi:nucleotide-binding universal stress UspA family protein